MKNTEEFSGEKSQENRPLEEEEKKTKQKQSQQ